MKIPRFFAPPLALLIAGSLLGGCSKPAPVEPTAVDPNAPAAPAIPPAPLHEAPPTIAGEPGAAAMVPPEEVAIGELEKRYPAANQEGRSALIEEISDRDEPEVAGALLRLFRLEQNVELRGEILSTMSVVEGQNETKLEAAKLGLAAPQQEVKEGALDLLSSVEDKAAIPLWQQLLTHPDQDTRELAKEMIDTLNSPPAAMP